MTEASKDSCVFCRIVRGEIPATVVLEDEQTLVFIDICSVNSGHMLVAAKPHVENLQGMDEAPAGAMFRSAALAAKAIERVCQPAGISVYQANGTAAGQTVFHAHIHVLPRWENDGLTFTWPVKNPSRAELEEVAARLRGAL